jgi:hypothetical protein
MTDLASTIATRRRTRRQLLAGGTGALAAALTAEALARPAPAAAANGDNVILGQENDETTVTTISNKTVGGTVLSCLAGGTGIAVAGTSGNGAGLSGESEVGDGVRGFAIRNGRGIFGSSDGGEGVRGESRSGIGVHGVGFNSATGLQGSSGSGAGVAGFSSTGTAVFGLTSSASQSAVSGQSLDAGPGVLGFSSKGTGVRASGKTALDVDGPAVFSRSGTLTIAAGQKSATKQGVDLTDASIVLVTAQNDVPGVAVRSAVPHVSSASFTVRLNKAPTKAVTVGWFIVN